MAVSSITTQSNNLYRQLQSSLTAPPDSTKNPKPASALAAADTSGDSDGTTSAASILSAASGQQLDSYA